jgi:hypothetical protein
MPDESRIAPGQTLRVKLLTGHTLIYAKTTRKRLEDVARYLEG